MNPSFLPFLLVAPLLILNSSCFIFNPTPAQAQSSNVLTREANDLLQQGIDQFKMSQFEAALQSWQQALNLYRATKDDLGEENALGNLGLAHYYLGRYAKALEYFEKTLVISKDIRDKISEGNSLGNLGLVYRALGNYAKAIEYQEKHLIIARAINDTVGEGNALGNLGNIYKNLGEYNKAIIYLKQSLDISQRLGNKFGMTSGLISLGLTYEAQGGYAESIEYSNRALVLAKLIGNRKGESDVFNNLGIVYSSMGNHFKAIEFYKQSLAIAQVTKDQQGQGDALNNLGSSLLESGNLTAAEKALLDGVVVWESIRQLGVGRNDLSKVTIFEKQARTYRLLQKVLVAQNKLNAALEIAERGRARAFVELLAQRLAVSGQPSASSYQPAIAPSNLQQIQQIARAQNVTLVQYSIIYDDFKIEGKKEARDAELYIWVIQPTGQITFHRADLKRLWQQQNSSLAELVRNSQEAIGVETIAARNQGTGTIDIKLSEKEQERRQAERRRALQQLYQLLIQPIAAELPKNPDDRVVFIPQGDLFLVPFPALMDAKGSYLLEKHTLQISPSIQVLGLTQQLKSTPRSANGTVVVGNPVMPYVWNPDTGKEVQLPDLQGAQQEAIAIAQQLKTQPLLWDKATKAAVIQQMQSARLIHLATHGLLDYGNPQELGVLDVPGAIALAPAGKDNGLLTSAEIADLKLNADLVVLSACDTGRGRLTSDGVIGLSRSFITAGVPSVMVSLWAVNDAATAELMQEFYRLWQNPTQRLNKAQALRQAMLTTMKKHPDPRLWAAFTLVGQAE